MKIETSIAKFGVVLLIIAVGILGTQFASIINSYNLLISRGILGLLVIYATYRNVLIPMAKEPIQDLFIYPRGIKYFIYMFFFSLISFWAFQQIFDMITGKNRIAKQKHAQPLEVHAVWSGENGCVIFSKSTGTIT